MSSGAQLGGGGGDDSLLQKKRPTSIPGGLGHRRANGAVFSGANFNARKAKERGNSADAPRQASMLLIRDIDDKKWQERISSIQRRADDLMGG